MPEPSGPVNGQNRVVEGLVTTGGVAGLKKGSAAAAVSGSAYQALDTVVDLGHVGGAAVALGATTSSSSIPVVLATDGTVIGAVNETAPASDTASSGLNGRLQRIAQRLTSLIALLPTALGNGGGLKIESVGTTPYQGGNTANSVNTGVVPAVAGKTSVLKGFAVTGAGATAASVIEVTVSDGTTFTQYFEVAIPAGANVGITPLVVNYGDGIRAGGTNTAMTVTAPAFGAGNTKASVQAWGGYV